MRFLLPLLLLATPAWAEPCRETGGAIPDLASALRDAAGVVDERDATGAVVLAMFDGFGPMVDFQSRLVARLPKGTKVVLVIPPGSDYADAMKEAYPDRTFVVVETPVDSNWSRDFVPDVVIGEDGKARLVQFAYGYPAARASAGAVAKKLKLPLVTSELRLDGGNRLVDGSKKRLLLTERTLKDNPGWTKAKIEAELKAKLAVKEIAWMPEVPGEPTGHIDMYAKLVGESTALVARAKDPAKKRALDDAAKKLARLGYSVKRVDVAGDGAGFYFPSYTNSLILGKKAYVPTYAEVPADHHRAKFKRADKAAADLYKKLGYTVVPMPSYYLLIQGGAVHCMTKTLPASVVP